MPVIKRTSAIMLILFLTVPLLFSTFTNAQPETGTPFEVKPVGIIYSNLSLYWKQQSYDSGNVTVPVSIPFYVVESQIYMAGLTYEVISENDIANASMLDKYSCIILPENQHTYNSTRLDLLDYYQQYLNNGGSIISMGFIAIRDEGNTQYADRDLFMMTLFNLKIGALINSNYSITTMTHPITSDYEQNTSLGLGVGIDNLTVNSTMIETRAFLKAVDRSNGSLLSYCGFASEIGDGRSVYIQVYDLGLNYWFDNTTLLLRALQWCIYRGYPAIGIQLTPGRVAWMFTVDQDWCFATANTTSALRSLIYLADTYYFTFGWAIISEGPVNQSDEFYGFINWTACKPLLMEAYSKGHDLASHSVTHVYWDLTPVTEQRVIDELNLSRYQINGNLSIVVEGLQVWGQGIWFSRYNASRYLSQVGYKYVTELSVESFPYLMGKEFYYSSDNYTRLDEAVFVLFRQSYSDHNYFSPAPMMNLNWTQAWAEEKKQFDAVYQIGNGMPYITLWHDYSIDNQSRLPLLYQMLDYEVWQKKDVYTCTPYEYYHRAMAHDSLSYNVTYNSNNTLTISLDTSKVSSEFAEYLTGQTIRIDNTTQYIQSVSLDGETYLAFSNNTVILPKLPSGIHNISVSLGSQPSDAAHIIHCTFGGPVSVSSNAELFAFNFTSPKQKIGRIYIETNKTPITVFINHTLTDQWYYKDNLLILSFNSSGNTLVEVYYSLRFSSSIPGVDKRIYFPNDPVYVEYTIRNSYPFPLSLILKTRISSGGQTVGEGEVNVTISPGQTMSGNIVTQPYESWPLGDLEADLQVISGYAVLATSNLNGAVYVYWFDGNLIIAFISVIAVFAAIVIVTNRYISSGKAESAGRFIAYGLFAASPIIFNLGTILIAGYHYSQILSSQDLNKLSTLLTIALPLAFSFFGLDLLSRRYTRDAALSEDTAITETSIKRLLTLSVYASSGVSGTLIIFSAATGIISLEVSLLIIIFTVPHILLNSLVGVYKGLEKLLTLTAAYLTATISATVLSLYVTYYLGLIGLIMNLGVAVTITDIFLYLYLARKFLKKESLPTYDPLFYGKLYAEKNSNIKLVVLGALIVNLFLILDYLVWFMYGGGLEGYTVLFNSQLQTPILVFQIAVFPALGIVELLFNRVKEKLNDFSRQVLSGKRTAKEEYKDLRSVFRRAVLRSLLAALIVNIPLVYFINDILLIFNLTPILSLAESALIAASFILFSVLWLQIKLSALVNLRTSIIGVSIGIILAIAAAVALVHINLFNPMAAFSAGFICGEAAASIYLNIAPKKLLRASAVSI